MWFDEKKKCTAPITDTIDETSYHIRNWLARGNVCWRIMDAKSQLNQTCHTLCLFDSVISAPRTLAQMVSTRGHWRQPGFKFMMASFLPPPCGRYNSSSLEVNLYETLPSSCSLFCDTPPPPSTPFCCLTVYPNLPSHVWNFFLPLPHPPSSSTSLYSEFHCVVKVLTKPAFLLFPPHFVWKRIFRTAGSRWPHFAFVIAVKTHTTALLYKRV